MAKKGTAGSGEPKGQATEVSGIKEVTEENIDKVENETIDKVNRTVTILEGAIATWDAAKEKTPDLADKFARYKKFHDALLEWETKVLRARGKKETFDTKVKRLSEFVDICYAFA